MRDLSSLNHDKAEYLKSGLKKAGFTLRFKTPTFNEFVMECPEGFETVYKKLLHKKIIAGLHLAPYYPELTNHYLFCVTETKSREDMDTLIREVK
jgi:glycine dehydrogenase subunit 1